MHDKAKVKSSFFWSAIDSFGTQGLGLAVSLTLAKLLGPSIFGLISMLTIFIAVANVFVNSGFSAALIRKQERTESDYSTTFYFSLSVAFISYGVLFVAAPYIAQFYNEPELILLTRVISLVLIINTFSIIPKVLLSINLNFKSQAKCSIVALCCSGTSALVLAYLDYGVWALIAQQLTYSITNTCFLNIVSFWKPKVAYCKKSFKDLFSFGSKLLVSSLIDTIYNNAYLIVIGKQYSAAQLGLFNQANVLASMPAMTITAIIQKVTYPMLSNIQHDDKKMDAAYMLTLQVSTFVIFPIMFGICIISKPLVLILLGKDWVASSEYISIITMALVLYPIHAINLNILQVKGRSDLF